MKLPPIGSLLSRSLLAAALFIPIQILIGQTVAPGGTAAGNDAAKRLEWLKSRVGAEAAPEATPASTPPALKKRFAEIRAPALRPLDVHADDTPAPKTTPAEKKIAETHPVTPAPHRTADAHPPEPTPAKKTRLAEHAPAETPTVVSHVPETPTASPSKKVAHAAATPAATPSPRPIAQRATPPPAATSSPRPIAQRATPTPAATPSPRPIAQRATPTPAATPSPRPIAQRATPPPAATPAPRNTVASRYPWKTNIVTTVFWIGEPVGGHNFTPNYSSSWDSHWTQAYGGFDNPNPEARRNFIPVKFTPRQNPFYVALPYNDVTRGTTKPEARVVIPWFKEAYRKEGQSVCRDRWVAIRGHTGRIVYAQWSDCGPFRTDHWQYVFGLEKPKPNLNQGAGLDVSPAVRDYLGLQSTDVTDWKFVEAREVPAGPWSLYGDNNTCPQKGMRFTKAGALPPEVAVTRIRPY